MIATQQDDWFQVTETGLTITGELTEERWKELGGQLVRGYRSVMWAIGDWINAGENSGYLPRGRLDIAGEIFGIATETARKASQVCRAIESGTRVPELTFQHHRVVAPRGDAKELLQWALENKASSRQLELECKRRDSLLDPPKAEVVKPSRSEPLPSPAPKPQPRLPEPERPVTTTLTVAMQASASVPQPAQVSAPVVTIPVQAQHAPVDQRTLFELAMGLTEVERLRLLIKITGSLSVTELGKFKAQVDMMHQHKTGTAPAPTKEQTVEPIPTDSLIPFDPLDIKIPEEIDTPGFRKSWATWVKYNAEEGHPLREAVATSQMEECAQRGTQAAMHAIKTAISKRHKEFPPRRESKAAVFQPPTVEEIQQYITENDIQGVGAEEFFNSYESKGWKVGQVKMADWKSAVRTWKCRNAAKGQTNGHSSQPIESAFKALTIPAKLNTQAFFTALCDWGKVMEANGKKPVITSMQTIVDKLGEYPLRRAIGYLKAWAANGKFVPAYNDCYEAYQPEESQAPAPKREYEPDPRLMPKAQPPKSAVSNPYKSNR